MSRSLIHQSLRDAASQHGDRVAIRAGEEDWSFRALAAASQAFAEELALRGVTKGHRVAVMSTNRIEFLIAVNAISRLGAASVLLSPAWKDMEVGHALGLTQPIHAVADGTAVEILAAHLGEKSVTDLGDPRIMALARDGATGGAATGGAQPTDEAVLVFSSGTTGLPKAVRHTHTSLAYATAHWVEVLALGPDDRFQIATPPSHILGLLNLLAATRAAATVRLHARFDLEEELHVIQAERMTLEMAVAPIALAMANHPDLESLDLTSLRYIMWGATPVTPSVANQVTERAGVRWLPAYGTSELPVLTCNPVHRPEDWRLDSPGLAAPDTSIRVVDLDSGQILPAGETGEIQARGPSLMAGYLPEEATPEVMVDGWYRTGDVGWLEPEGWIHLTDRSKEMIKVNGFQVAPAELEALLHTHPSVLDCAVFGITDERAGEVPIAAVQLDPSRPTTAEALIQLVAGKLATYKHLRDVEIVETIPRLPSGKVLRRTLRADRESR